ncbi:DNA polymerase III subunit alpha [Caulobacter vibrioides]|uniref:DNA polymerase III subunit alpha n=1 Tax=Caulobacter vibrioides TaxID=155892 RepID=UPI000BB5276E|nr:DNA polymerase III subunit alpha [Caulobacter vibrioides]ATC24891.1 DNA polymerase III subunit alpha [Caulobacter vibrioides]AZH13046.1 DNA polymerase III subunit alpha [Caulobacter vibrioides]PLR09669.1 DNA polymerase III subunit alpha [Caulobacter vibrioides]
MSDAEGQGFVHLRVRSAYSLLEGAIKADHIGKLAAEAKMPAAGLADRANLFGALEYSSYAKDAGVQPIIGCAIPVVGIGGGPTERWARAPTLMLLAQNERGYLNLSELSSIAYLDSAELPEPVVPWAKVAEHSEGLILLSGGTDGPVDALFAAGKTAEASAALAEMHRVFGDRFYVELQRHGLPRQAAAEPGLVNWAYDHDVPLVATNDVYFAKPGFYDAHDALLCISDGAFVGQDERRRVTPEHWFKPAEEMRKLFADLPEACDNTLDIARRCAFMVHKRDPILPSFPTGDGRNEAEELEHQAREGLKMRLEGLTLSAPEEEYWKRLDFELGIIKKMGFPGYFLIVSDFIKWGKAHGIPVGPGRGSGAGSLVAWVLTITDLDPLRFGLLFERFLNPERVSMPDFDVDFCQERREEVISYVQEKYGRDRVAQIITFGSLQARAVLRDVGRVMQLPLGLVDRLCKMVPNNPAAPVTLAQAIDLEPRLKQAKKEDANVSACLDVALQLEGLFRNASTHAAGLVIGDRPLTQLTPLYKDPRSDLPATQFNMKWVESAGLVKFDFLGLKTLTVLDRAVKHLKKRGFEIDLGKLPFDDAKTYELLASGQTVGVFQLESQGMRDTLRKMRCGSIEEITALISLYRPGPMDNIDTFVDCKFGRKPVDTLHPSLEAVLKETYGVIVYQEQVMQIAQILAGYSLGEADLLRRAMGKKKKEEMDLQKIRFVSGAKEKNVPEEQSGSIFELVAKFAGYGFNKSHAAAYAFISYQTAWLKANTPVEFFAASMSLDLSNTDKLAVFHQDARRFGITVRAPDVNRSGADFEVENGEVLYALGAIRNVGLEAMKHLVAVRAEGGPFRDVFDFVERIDPRQVNKRAIENLARAGAFDSIHKNRAQIVASADVLIAHAQSCHADRQGGQGGLFGSDPGAGRPRLSKTENWNQVDLLDEELSAVGFYLTGHPLEDMVGMLRRRRTVMLAEAMAQAEAGAEAFRMCGVVRRRQERASQSGEKFAFVSLSDPTGEYEVLYPPESLRKCRDVLEPGKAVAIKVRAKARDGEVRFFGDDAEPIEKAVENVVAGLRVHLSPSAAEIDALKRRLEPAQAQKGGEVTFVAAIGGGREIELRLPGRYTLDAALRGALKTAPGVALLEDV